MRRDLSYERVFDDIPLESNNRVLVESPDFAVLPKECLIEILQKFDNWKDLMAFILVNRTTYRFLDYEYSHAFLVNIPTEEGPRAIPFEKVKYVLMAYYLLSNTLANLTAWTEEEMNNYRCKSLMCTTGKIAYICCLVGSSWYGCISLSQWTFCPIICSAERAGQITFVTLWSMFPCGVGLMPFIFCPNSLSVQDHSSLYENEIRRLSYIANNYNLNSLTSENEQRFFNANEKLRMSRYQIVLNDRLPQEHEDEIQTGIIYITNDKKYCVRNQFGKIAQGSFEAADIDLNDHSDIKKYFSFKSRLLGYLSDKGHAYRRVQRSANDNENPLRIEMQD